MKNFISPLRFKNSNYVIRLFSNNKSYNTGFITGDYATVTRRPRIVYQKMKLLCNHIGETVWSWHLKDQLGVMVFLTVFSRVLRDYTPRFVGPSVSLSVDPSHFTFLWSMASLFLPKWSSDLKYSPCPTARDKGSRVSDLVFLICCDELADDYKLKNLIFFF